jgi:hypothetical protein
LDADTIGDIEDVGVTDEIVVDRIVAHGTNDDGQYMVRIRWHGQDKSEDTKQEATDLPRHFVERYAKKKKIAVTYVMGPSS